MPKRVETAALVCIALARSKPELTSWGESHRDTIHSLPTTMQATIRAAYRARLGELEEARP